MKSRPVLGQAGGREWTAIAEETQPRLVRAINFLPAPGGEKSTYTCAEESEYWREYGLSLVAGADDGIWPEMVADRMRSTCADDMNKMGLEVISFTIKEVRDKNEYISNMGRPDVARIKRDADVATAEAERDTAILRANALRDSSVNKAKADQERVIAETASQTRQAEAQRDLDIKKAEYAEQSRRQQAIADKAYELQTNVMLQQVTAEQVKVQQVEREGQIKVQEAEILRNEKQLIATVLKASEIERQRIENMAAAEKNRLTTEAEGRASAIRAQGEAEASIIFQKGEAEAKAMSVKAEAYQEWNQAAVVDKLLTNMADVGRAID